jgi:hypothetical protein
MLSHTERGKAFQMLFREATSKRKPIHTSGAAARGLWVHCDVRTLVEQGLGLEA